MGRGSIFRVPHEEKRAITFTGTIIPGNGCMFIDNGTERYIIEGEFPAGSGMRVTGVLAGSRIIPDTAEPAEKAREDVAGRLAALVARLDTLPDKITFTPRMAPGYMGGVKMLLCHRRCKRNG